MPFALLMPSFNQARFIGEAVDSVLAQEDPDWELWILDNSTDETPQVMASYRDGRIHFVHEPARMDPGTCLNWMLERVQGEHFSYIHTDNRLLPSFVGAHRRALAAHPLALAVCDYWEITEAGQRRKLRRRQDPFPLRRLFSVDTIGVPFAATVELARRLGGFSASDLADDVLFVLRADPLGPRVHLHQPQIEVPGARRLPVPGQRRGPGAAGHPAQHRPGLPGAPGGGRDAAGPVRRRGCAGAGARGLGRSHGPGAGGSPAGRRRGGPAVDPGHRPGQLLAGLGLLPARPGRGRIPGPRGGAAAGPARARRRRPRARSTLRPRARRGVGESLRWLLRGLPPLDHPLKRLPGDVMCALLVPYLAAGPAGASVFLHGDGALAAYLAYGAQVLGGLRVEGLLEGRAGWPPLEGQGPRADADVWVVPGGVGPGRVWSAGR